MAGESLEEFQALVDAPVAKPEEDTGAKNRVMSGRGFVKMALLAALAAAAIGCDKDKSPVYDNETSGDQDRAGATEKASKVELDCGPNLCPFPRKNDAPSSPVTPVPAPKAPTPSSAELTQGGVTLKAGESATFKPTKPHFNSEPFAHDPFRHIGSY